jgi:putative ABC transport system permease protein
MDLRYGWRAVLRSPGFSLLVILTFAVGIAATTTMFSAVWALFLRPLPFPEPDRLVTVWQTSPRSGDARERVIPADFADWQARSRSFESLGVLPNWTGAPWTFNVVAGQGVERVNGIYASSGFFATLRAAPVLGQPLHADDDRLRGRRSVVISENFWRRRFGGGADVIGKTIEVDTFRGGPFTIVGVMPRTFDLPRGTDLWLSLADWGGGPMPAPGAQERCCHWYTVVGRLKRGVTAAAAAADLTSIARDTAARVGGAPASAGASAVSIVSLRDTLTGDYAATVTGLFIAVGCVLLIGCANVANLLLSRGVSRRREVFTRRALGATSGRLARQLLAETWILGLIGAGVGLLASLWAQAVVKATLAERLPYVADMRTDWVVVGFSVLLAMTVSTVCGLVPLVASSGAGWNVRGQTESPGTRRLRHGLVIAEVAIAIVVVGLAGLFARTVSNLRAVDVGFETGQTVVVKTDLTTTPLRERGAAAGFTIEALERLGALPGVSAVGATTGVPFEGGAAATAITRQGDTVRSESESPRVVQSAVTTGYFQAMSIALLRGRTFTPEDRADGPLVAVINQTAARRYWPGEDPIGKRFAIGSRERFGSFRAVRPGEIEWREIVGVVADIRSAGFASDVQPEVFYSTAQFPLYDPSFAIRTTGEPALPVETIRATLSSINPRAVIVRVRTMEEIAQRSIADPRLRAAAATLFSAVALLLGMLGIYSLMAYTVTQQHREIGIRLALGARRDQVARMIVGKAIRLAAAGAGLGVAGAYAAARGMSTLFFGVGPGDPIVLASACGLLIAAAAVAAAGPARRALDVDPAVALRSE